MEFGSHRHMIFARKQSSLECLLKIRQIKFSLVGLFDEIKLSQKKNRSKFTLDFYQEKVRSGMLLHWLKIISQKRRS
jgi:hypothetical protein